MREDQQLEIFIRKHYSSMCAVALRFIGSPDIAQDITQEVIIKFWKNRANYENIKSTDNFLYTMIKNEALNYLRGSQREKQRYNHLEVEEFEHPKVLNMLIEEEINQILIHAIDLLPVQSARIMRLFLSGYENKEIAKVMGVSVNTIKTLKYSAIRKLREYFNSNDYELDQP